MKLTGHEILCIMKIIYRFSMGKVCSFLWACDSIKFFSQGKVIGIRIWEFCCDNIQPNLFTNNHFNTEQTNS